MYNNKWIDMQKYKHSNELLSEIAFYLLQYILKIRQKQIKRFVSIFYTKNNLKYPKIVGERGVGSFFEQSKFTI